MSGAQLLGAAIAGSMMEIREQVRNGADINYRDGGTGFTALMIVAGQGDGKMTDELLKMGADTCRVDRNGHTALVFASQYPDIANMLITSGARMDYRNPEGKTLLHLTCTATPEVQGNRMSGRLKVAQMFLDEGADVNGIDAKGLTPLHYASSRGRVALMGLFIRRGAKIDAQNEEGATPLMMAVTNQQLVSVKILHREGANALLPFINPESRNGKSMLPLEIASEYGNLDIVQELVQLFGIRGCGGPSGGVDALANAVEIGHVGMVALLLDAGVVDTGEALFLANHHGNCAVMKILVQRRWGDSEYLSGAGCIGKWLSGEPETFIQTPLGRNVTFCKPSSPRLAHFLIEAGASIVDWAGPQELHPFKSTPIGRLNQLIREKTTGVFEPATQAQLYAQNALLRVIVRADAVTAYSWLWPTEKDGKKANDRATKPTDLTGTMTVLRRRARRRGGVAFPSMTRCSSGCEIFFFACGFSFLWCLCVFLHI